MGQQPIIVVGAGVGGLVAALALAAQGLEVVVCEAQAELGGKVRQVHIGGQALDAGPTVFTMRWVFDELFSQVGETLGAHLDLHKVETLARHTWGQCRPFGPSTDSRNGQNSSGPESSQLDLYANIDRSADAIGNFAGAAEARRYLAFCKRARLIYQTLEGPFLRATRPNPLSLSLRVASQGVAGLARISPFGTMWRELGQYFQDPRLQQLFGRYATYCGSSPFMAPATLMLVAHVEQDGVWLIDGGMHALVRTLAALAARRGATFRYGAPVAEILTANGRASGVRLADGETITGAAVVFNGDAAALASGLLGAAAIRSVASVNPATRSLSAITWNLVTPVQGFPLLRHNVFFSGDSRAEFAALFAASGAARLPPEPTVYLCAQDRTDKDSTAPLGGERLLCLVNAPANGDTLDTQNRAMTQDNIERCEQATFARLKRSGLRLDSNAVQTLRTTPSDFNRLFPATGGALYGQASHGWMASFARPGSRSRLDGLYLAGGSTHPGPGMPMAALSGRQAASSVLADLARQNRQARQGADSLAGPA